MQNSKALIAGITTFAVGLAIAFSMRGSPQPSSQQAVNSAPSTVSVVEKPFVGPRGLAAARADLAALPELRAWFAHLEKTSSGSVHGALIEYGPTPKEIGGKRYWQFSFVENMPDAAHRWESFLVGHDNGNILVEDLEAGTTLTLDQWRKEKNPLARTSAK